MSTKTVTSSLVQRFSCPRVGYRVIGNEGGRRQGMRKGDRSETEGWTDVRQLQYVSVTENNELAHFGMQNPYVTAATFSD